MSSPNQNPSQDGQGQGQSQKKPPPTPGEVAKKLKDILYSLTDTKEWVKRFIEWGFKNLTPEKLDDAIKTNFNPLLIAFNHFHLSSPIVAPLARIILKMYWDTVEEHLLDANKIKGIISQNPDLDKIISTSEGIDYLNRVIPFCYDYLYSWVWES